MLGAARMLGTSYNTSTCEHQLQRSTKDVDHTNSIQLEAQIANIVRQALMPSVQRLATGKKMLCEYSGVTG